MSDTGKVMKRFLGDVRRSLYGLYDNFLYTRWRSEQESSYVSQEFEYQPTISIVVPTYNTDIAFFDTLVESVFSQVYKKWELVFVDDKSPNENIRERIIYYAEKDDRVKYKFLDVNQHISGATNQGFLVATGEFVGLLDHDDVLHRYALHEVVDALNKNARLDFIYTDEDKVVGNKHMQPFFKPRLNRELLHAVNYITHFSVIRKSILDTIGGEDGHYNGAQDWELFLRVIRSVPAENIHHIPKILYSWRVHELSTSKDMGVKPYVIKAQEDAIRDDLNHYDTNDFSLALHSKYSGQWRVSYVTEGKANIVYVQNLSDVTEEMLKSSQYIAVVKGVLTQRIKEAANTLVSDAQRGAIGVVVTGDHSVVSGNMNALLGASRAQYVNRLTRISISKHIYRTTRYTLEDIVDYTLAVVSVDRLDSSLRAKDVQELGRELTKKGFLSLFIPFKDTL